MPLHDFKCPNCGHIQEEIHRDPEEVHCEKCGEVSEKVFLKAASVLKVIIPSYPGCLAQKAGYVHTHGDKPATKIMSGPAGCTKPPGN